MDLRGGLRLSYKKRLHPGRTMATATQELRDEPQTLEPPQREAAFFYGLFMHGHSLEELRRDIGVPGEVVSRWQRLWRHEPRTRRRHERMLRYRLQVLAIFNTLVSLELALSHLRQ